MTDPYEPIQHGHDPNHEIIPLPNGARLELRAYPRVVDVTVVGANGVALYSEYMAPSELRHIAEWLLTAAERSERRRRTVEGRP